MEKLRGKDLIKLGYKQGPAISLALQAIEKNTGSYREKLDLLEDVLVNPELYRFQPDWDKVVEKLYPAVKPTDLREKPVDVEIYGAGIIEQGAFHQIFQAAKLPISVRAALMPDAHQGYGLPIGGVLAVENAVIPYGVGVDIGCRMALSVFPLRPFDNELHKNLDKATVFGAGGERSKSDKWRKKIDTSILDRSEFDEIKVLKNLHDKATAQIGTSGSGNHFAEWGEVVFTDDTLLPKGTYLGLLTHSGSRGLGAKIAQHYTQLAKRLRKLDSTVANLAWFYLDEPEGIEYWNAMNLAGDYAKACHDGIHTILANMINEKPLLKIENHHNFAWKEIHDNKEVIVHRKGATPAGKGVLGIIPGSMATPGYIVMGKGDDKSLHSASHGAGRLMSRSSAKQNLIWSTTSRMLTDNDIKLIGGGIDESPDAYKDISVVMSHQKDLVDVLATFFPKIVKMAGADEEPEE